MQAMKVIEGIAYSLVRQVMTIDWDTLGGLLCRWHCHYCILHGRICPLTADLEGGYGEEEAE